MNYDRLTQKKERLDRLKPFSLALEQNLAQWFRTELTYTSNGIEGNTLTRQETALVIEKGITAGSKSLLEYLEAVNHVNAWDWIQYRVSEKTKSISERDILDIHERILKGIDDTNAGRYRSIAVRIAGSRVVLPNSLKVPTLMEAFADWLKEETSLHPVEKAAMAHYKLVSIHPFTDGNGRTARLLMNWILIQAGYPPAIIRKEDRLRYINSLEKAQLGGSLEDYQQLVLKAVDRSLNIYLKALSSEEDIEKSVSKNEALIRIGVLAKRTGETTATIRYWTKEGLLEVAQVTPSGYQLYPDTMTERVKQIRTLQAKHLTLAEIHSQIILHQSTIIAGED